MLMTLGWRGLLFGDSLVPAAECLPGSALLPGVYAIWPFELPAPASPAPGGWSEPLWDTVCFPTCPSPSVSPHFSPARKGLSISSSCPAWTPPSQGVRLTLYLARSWRNMQAAFFIEELDENHRHLILFKYFLHYKRCISSAYAQRPCGKKNEALSPTNQAFIQAAN